jgi:parallel beta-helix repeat protein
MKKFVSELMLTLLITSMLPFMFNVQPVKSEWTGTVYIRADGRIDPPDAPIITHDKITYKLIGDIRSYGDGIIIERDNIILVGDGYGVHGVKTTESKGITLSKRANITIENIYASEFNYGIYIDGSINNCFSRNTITSNTFGILLNYSSNNTISSNYITGNYDGIFIDNSSNYNIVLGNEIKSNNGIGIIIRYSSNYNTVSCNNIAGNSGGITLWECSNNTISVNNITKTSVYGIYLWGSSNNAILNNNMTNLGSYGIWFVYSSDNTISDTTLASNFICIELKWSSNNILVRNSVMDSASGVRLYESFNNKIYHNNFINNKQQTYDYSWDDPKLSTSFNAWDDGYPSGGNYWSDYTGVDGKSGPNQDMPGSDGIGDTPYVIDKKNVDRYPLMQPFSSRKFAFVFPRTSLFNVGRVEFYLPGLRVEEGFISVDSDGYVRIDIKDFIVGLYANALRIGSMGFNFQWYIIRAKGGERNTLPVYTYADADDWLYVGQMTVTVGIGNLEPWSKYFNFTLDLTKLEKQAKEFYEWVTKILDALDKAQSAWDLINKIQAILSSLGITEICPAIITINPDLIMQWLPDSLNPWGQYSAVYTVACPANLYITSPSGLTIGTNYNGEDVNQIPNSYYSGKNVDPQIVWLLNASTGDYKVDLIGTQNGSTTCGVALITPANISTSAIQIEVSEGQIIHLESTVSPNTLTIPEFPSIFVPALIIVSCLILLAVSKKKEEKIREANLKS